MAPVLLYAPTPVNGTDRIIEGRIPKSHPKVKEHATLAMTARVRYNMDGGSLVTDQHHTKSWYKRFMIAAAVLFGAVLALLAAIVIIAPKVINSGEVRSRIEAVIAKELHGTIAFDRVELSLLPRPYVFLNGVAVDIPGTLSATIASVSIHAHLIPLFRGQFAVSSVALEQPRLSLTLPDNSTRRRPRKPPTTQPVGGSFDKALAVAGRELPDLSIKISKGTISLAREGRELISLTNVGASLAFVSFTPEGPADGKADEYYHVTGSARATLTGTTALPAPLLVSIDRLDATPGNLTIKSSRARLQDLDAYISGSLRGYLASSPRSDIQAHGTIGPEALAWLQKVAGLPESMSLRAPLTVTEARLRSTGTGSDTSRTLTVNAGKKDGTTISLSLRQEPGLFSIDALSLKDSDSNAEVKFSTGSGGIYLSFAGNLSGATIDRILERGRFSSAWIKGDLQARMPQGNGDGATVHGSLEGGHITSPASRTIPVAIDRFTLLADGTSVDLRPVVLSLGQEILKIEGTASLDKGGVELDLDVITDRLSLPALRELVERKTEKHHDGKGPEPGSRPAVSGNVRLRAEAFVLDQYKADALDLHVTFGRDRTAAILEHASVCGITVTGSLRTAGSEVEVSLKPQALGKKLEEAVPCILHKELGMSGTYDLSGQISGRGTWDTLLRSLEGSFALSASQGRIQSDHVVKGIIAYLNSTSLLKGSHADLLKEGVPYATISIRGTFRDGTISLSEAVIKSRDLNIAAEGNIGLREGTLALNVLAAPFTRLDRLLGSVPLVKSLVGNALIVVPARVEGTFDRPIVRPLPVSGVGKDVTNLMNNVLKAPMKIIDPVLPKELERKNDQPQK